MLHRPSLTYHGPALLLDLRASGISIIHLHGQVPKPRPQVIRRRIPVVRKLNHRAVTLIGIANERQRELAIGIVVAAQQFHAEQFGIELDRAVQVADPDHRVQEAHRVLRFAIVKNATVPKTRRPCRRRQTSPGKARQAGRTDLL